MLRISLKPRTSHRRCAICNREVFGFWKAPTQLELFVCRKSCLRQALNKFNLMIA